MYKIDTEWERINALKNNPAFIDAYINIHDNLVVGKNDIINILQVSKGT